MTAMELLLLFALAVAGWWVVGAVADYLLCHHPVDRITQAVRAAARRLPDRTALASRLRTDLSHARARWAERVRHRIPQE